MRHGAGPSGEVRCGHQVAATLGPWRMGPRGPMNDPDPDGGWGVSAEVVDRNDFWLDFGGRLDLVLFVGDEQYTWRNVLHVFPETPGLRIIGVGRSEEEKVNGQQ